jgi:hypothetical protein
MDLSSLMKSLETERLTKYLEQLDVQQLVQNPYLLGTIGGLALLALIMRWRLLLVTLMAVSGFVWLIYYIQQRGTELHGRLAGDTLLLFVGGGVALIGLAIYFLFVKE